MLTKHIVEGLLYVSGGNELVRHCFELCHILNKTDRNWESKPHLELFYLDNFKYPKFLMIIDKQLHVYVIGEKAKGKTYNIIKIDGFTAEHYTINKSELKNYIVNDTKEAKKLYLPDNFGQRIIFIKPDYENNILPDNNLFIFNRLSSTGNIFAKSTWSLGVDIYSMDPIEYDTDASEILKAIYDEF